MTRRGAATPALPAPTRLMGRLRPLTWLLVAVLGFVGLSGVAGGLAMVVAPDGSVIRLDPAVLTSVPVLEDWLVPGLFLMIALGLAPLATAWAVVRRPSWRWASRVETLTGRHPAWAASLALGVLLLVFILYEATVVTQPGGRWLQGIMAAAGAASVALAASPTVRRDLTSRTSRPD